jgi:hypothetical protein
MLAHFEGWNWVVQVAGIAPVQARPLHTSVGAAVRIE